MMGSFGGPGGNLVDLLASLRFRNKNGKEKMAITSKRKIEEERKKNSIICFGLEQGQIGRAHV